MKEIKQNEADATKRRVLISCVDATDYATPEPGEAGGQPQKSVNCGAWTNTSGVLVALDAPNGDYYVEFTQAEVNLSDITTIETRYKSANTAWAYGRTVKIVVNTPADVKADVGTAIANIAALDTLVGYIYAIVAHATYGLAALKTLIDGLAAGVWAYATRKLTSRNITTGEHIASQESMVRSISNGNIPYMETVIDDIPVEIIRGDRKKLPLPLSAGWDLTGRKAYFILKKVAEADNSTAIVNRECTIIDAVNCEIILTEEETAIVDVYHAEVEVRDLDETNPQTAKQFPVKIKQDVRQ